MLKPATQRGFTLIELMVSLSVFAILVALAVPNLSTWIANSQVRSVAEALQNGLRLAEAEAVRQNRKVQFSLTNNAPSAGATAVANGSNWIILTVPLLTTSTGTAESPVLVEGGQFANVAAYAQINSTDSNSASFATVTFGPFGTPATGGPAYPVTYKVSAPSSNRPLDVIVYPGGEVRLCDPAQSLANSPLGC